MHPSRIHGSFRTFPPTAVSSGAVYSSARGRACWFHRAHKSPSLERVVRHRSRLSAAVHPAHDRRHGGSLARCKILLDEGASISIVSDDGFSALNLAAFEGHPGVTKVLVEAGADLEAADSDGATPLHNAAIRGHSEVVSVLIDAGADPDSLNWDEMTPLYLAAGEGHLDAVKVLLRAKADPISPTLSGCIPLETAAEGGHSDVVRELIQQLGIEGCGGTSDGGDALEIAARAEHVEVMSVLTDAGVADTGQALIFAAIYGREASLKFLLLHHGSDFWDFSSGEEVAYVNVRDAHGRTPLVYTCCGLGDSFFPSARIVRILVEAGADTTSPVRITDSDVGSKVVFDGTPLALTNLYLREKTFEGTKATEDQLHRLEAVRRLLLQVEAVHAVSWLWPNAAPSISYVAAEGANKSNTTSTPLIAMLPILRRRTRRRVNGLFVGLLRRSKKP